MISYIFWQEGHIPETSTPKQPTDTKLNVMSPGQVPTDPFADTLPLQEVQYTWPKCMLIGLCHIILRRLRNHVRMCINVILG